MSRTTVPHMLLCGVSRLVRLCIHGDLRSSSTDASFPMSGFQGHGAWFSDEGQALHLGDLGRLRCATCRPRSKSEFIAQAGSANRVPSNGHFCAVLAARQAASAPNAANDLGPGPQPHSSSSYLSSARCGVPWSESKASQLLFREHSPASAAATALGVTAPGA